MANRTYEDWIGSGIPVYDAGNYDLAAHHFHMARTCNPYREEASYNLGLVRLKQERWKDCIELCDEAISINPSHRPAHENRAESLILLGRFDEAEKAIDFLGQLRTGISSDATIAHLRGILNCYMNKLPESHAYFNQAIALNKEYQLRVETMQGFTTTQIGDR